MEQALDGLGETDAYCGQLSDTLAQEAGAVKVAVRVQVGSAEKEAVTVQLPPEALIPGMDQLKVAGNGAEKVAIPPQEDVMLRLPELGGLFMAMVPLNS